MFHSVDSLPEALLGLEAFFAVLVGLHPLAFVVELSTLGVGGARDDLLVLVARNCVLEFFPGRVGSVAKLACAFNTARFEALGAPAHAQGLLGLGLVLARTHHPVTVLLLLLLKDLGVSGRQALLLRWSTELNCAVVREGKRFLATCSNGERLASRD